MKPMMTRKGQVYSVGNYLMNGKVLGKGHFARVEEATHRIIGKKVAIKIIDLTCIKEEYARRNLHREPKVMARLRHPCIAALYETMMHGPRLYVVMEAAGGGDLCAHVLNARAGNGGARGLPEGRARALSAQLVSAVRHMHARGVVHRDLKMENIMLDGTKQFIKIVDFGLSNVWSASGGLRTPCGSLEYAAPELFLDNRRYGPEVDLWSVGVIVYGMVTGSLPFGGGGGAACEGGGRSRPQLRAAIARGFARKHRAALAHLSPECKIFVQQLLEPNVETRMKIEEAARHRWLRKPGMRLQAHPLPDLELKTSRTIVKQISELSGQSLTDVTAEIKVDPYGSIGGMYNIKTHLTQLLNAGSDMIWTNSPDTQARPVSPPIYHPHSTAIFRQSPQIHRQELPSQPSHAICKSYSQSSNSTPFKSHTNSSTYTAPSPQSASPVFKQNVTLSNPVFKIQPTPYKQPAGISPAAYRQSPSNSVAYKQSSQNQAIYKPGQSVCKQTSQPTLPSYKHNLTTTDSYKSLPPSPAYNPQSPSSIRPGVKHRGPLIRPLSVRKPLYRVNENGDGVEARLPSIDEHSKLDVDKGRGKTREEERLRITSCPDRAEKRAEFYRRAGDGLPCNLTLHSWRATGVTNNSSARILLQSNATTIKRASLGNIVSPHSSSNSHCKSDRAAPVGWYSTRNTTKETTHLQRLRRTAPIK